VSQIFNTARAFGCPECASPARIQALAIGALAALALPEQELAAVQTFAFT
jgi:hypothetical protein